MSSTARPRAGETGRPPSGRVVGIDPGLNVTGYAVVEPSARGPYVVEAGVIRPGDGKVSMGRRLAVIHQGVVEVLDAFPPRRWRWSRYTATSSTPGPRS